MTLTPHFTLDELSFSATATRMGIDNTPALQIHGSLRLLAEGLEKVRRLTGDHGLRIHDAYRCEKLERVLCKGDFDGWCFRHKKNVGTLELLNAAWQEYFAAKAHPKGFAADFTCAAFGNPTEIVRVIRASGLKFDEVIVEGTDKDGKGGWVHLSFATAMRGIARIATFDSTGTPHYEEMTA